MSINKRVLISGITGQDGSLLANHLLREGLEVSGTFRRGSENNLWRLEEMGILQDLKLYDYTIGSNSIELAKIISNEYDYIFHLAGDSFTEDSFRHPYKTISINLTGCLEILENSLEYSPESKIFIACSSEIYGKQLNNINLVTENSPRNPLNPYGISQSTNLDVSRLFRNTYSQFVSVGILFNHESEYRGAQFLTRKISTGLSLIKNGSKQVLSLGNLNSSRDWGSAKEYVKVFKKILDHNEPDDYIIATGKSTTVRQIVLMCCAVIGFDPEFQGEGKNEICIDRKTGKTIIKISPEYFRKMETPCLTGSTDKVSSQIGWSPQVPVSDVIEQMCEADLKRLVNTK